MRKTLFFLKAYPWTYRYKILILFFFESVKLDRFFREHFQDFILESRAILGFIYLHAGKAQFDEEGMRVQFKMNNKILSLSLRWNSSDFLVFNQVFIKEEYKPLSLHKIDNPIIVDAGANIGCTSIYLSAFYSKAKLIAIEPDHKNFEKVKQNFRMNNLDTTYCLEMALWFNQGKVFISDNFRDKRNWSMIVSEVGEKEVEACTLQNILEKTNSSHIDIMKMDIEGAEESIFKNDKSIINILSTIRYVAIEIHQPDSPIQDLIEKIGLQTFTESETLFALSVNK